MRLHVPWGRVIRLIESIFFKESMIDRAFCHVEFCIVTELYVSSPKVRVIQSPVSQNRVDRTVFLPVRVTSGLCRSWYSGVVVCYLCRLT